MFRLNTRTRIAKFRPKAVLPDPRPVEVMYNASELVHEPRVYAKRGETHTWCGGRANLQNLPRGPVCEV